MRNLAILVISLMQLSLNAQTGSHLVIQFDGLKLSGSRLSYEQHVLKDAYFDLDGQRIETKNIAFFKNNHGYFANLDSITKSKESYALRIKEGRISQYEIIDIEIYGGDQLRIPEDMVQNSPMLASGESFQYYTKNDGAIQKAKFKNLKVDLGDRSETSKYLNNFRKYRWFQRTIIALGLGVTAGSLAVKPDDVSFTPLTALGIVIGGSAYFFEYSKNDELRNAVDAYNQ